MTVCEIPADASVVDELALRVRHRPNQPMFARKSATGASTVSAAEFAARVRAVAAGLVAAGVEAGDRVALMASARYEWILCDFAIWQAGAVTVPIYETSSAEQVSWIIRDSGARAMFAADQRLARLAGAVQAPELGPIWTMDEPGLDAVVASGIGVAPELLEERAAGPSARPATIVYTSGTTGRPKGCVLTHANLLAEVRNVLAAEGIGELVLTEQSRLLLFLPPAHILTRVVQLAAVRGGALTGFTDDLANLPDRLAEFRPTVLLGVPRVFEKFYNGALRAARTPVRSALFGAAARVAVAFSRALDRPHGPGPALRLRHQVFEALVYPVLRDALGGRVRYAVSGGAPLDPWLAHFCRGVGITVLEGWGLTETTAGVTLNLPGAQRIGTVGRAVPGCEVRIAADGEVLARGPNVFAGYWGNPAATEECLDEDGWLRTGDIGRLDDGYLRIIGRKKELIVTAGGKNVAPAPFEDKLRTHWLVDQCVVVGDNRPYVGALVTLDLEAFALWKREHRKPAEAPVALLRSDADLVATVQTAVDEANLTVSKAEAVRRFTILTGQFAVSDELTPTQKVRRAYVLAKFAKEIDEMYKGQ